MPHLLCRRVFNALWMATAALSLAGCASSPPTAADVLARASQAMGATQLESIRYAGEGKGEGEGFAFGQAFLPNGPWPKVTYHSVTRTVDYEAGAMHDAVVLSRAEPRGGGGAQVLSFTQPGRYRAAVTVNAEGLVTQVDSVFPDPVLGDTQQLTLYSDYRDFNGVKFPTRVRQSSGGHPVQDLTVREV